MRSRSHFFKKNCIGIARSLLLPRLLLGILIPAGGAVECGLFSVASRACTACPAQLCGIQSPGGYIHLRRDGSP